MIVISFVWWHFLLLLLAIVLTYFTSFIYLFNKGMDANLDNSNGIKGVGKSLNSPVMQKVHFPKVPPDTSGEGLPYAPFNWPNDGDVWVWKVGKRVSTTTGFFCDRYLVVPKHLHSTGVRCLGSKPAVARYIQSRWPAADIGAFFASFSWKVPAKLQSGKKVPTDTPRPRKVPKMQAKQVCGRGTHRQLARKHHLLGQRTRRSARQLVAQFSTKDANAIIDLCSESDATAIDMSDHTITNSNKLHCFDSPAHSSSFDDPTYPLEILQPEGIPEDFEIYLNSLEDILAQPHQCIQVSPPTTQLVEARTKLSAILRRDLCALLSCKDLVTEVMTLSTMLQKYSTLSAPEQSTLKLIEEIPARIKDFEETRKVKANAEKFFIDLEANLIRASNLKSEYINSGKNACLLRDKIKSASLAIEEIDEQISALQSRRAQASAAIEKAKREIARFTSKQEEVVRHLPKVVQEVQLAQFGRSEWELKKKIAADREVKILEEFSRLKGFSF